MRPAAVNEQFDSGDEAGVIRGQEQRRLGDFVRFAESFGAAAERARDAKALRAALKRAFARRDGPTLIEVPVGPLPSPWEFIHMPPARGKLAAAR